MKRRLSALFLAVLMMLTLSGCGETAGKIADSVMDAAVAELKNQVKLLLEQNKLEVVEIKTAFGKLNDDGSKHQFFIAALVKANSDAVAKSTANALGKLFTDAGLTVQSDSQLENSHLVHKSITFKLTDFSAGGYYVIWAYASDLSIQLPDLSQLIEATIGK